MSTFEPLLASDRVPPAVAFLLREVLVLDRQLDDEPSPLLLERLEQAYDAGEPWLSADPAFAAFAHRLLDRRAHPRTRQQGCIWLTLFPSVEMVDALAAVALDEREPLALRDQAAWSLGFRQAQGRHPSFFWSEEVVARADDALIQLAESATAAGKIALAQLPLALRHVDAPALFDVFAKAPALWGEAYEAFATPAFARLLLERLDDVAEAHVLRATRLVAATLGEEAMPAFLDRARAAEPGDRIELLSCALAFQGERVLPAFEDAIRGMRVAEPFRARARYHLANPGVVPTTRALRTARVTARIPAAERAARCAAAADDFAALASHQVHAEAYLYDLWAWMVRGADDPARARALCEVHPASTRRLRDLYLRALAEAGRVGRLATAAREHRVHELGAWLLATHGRPFAALELADAARTSSAESLAARVVAAFCAGRPDLAERLLADEAPPAAVVSHQRHAFPGPDERWRVAHARDRHPVLAALVDQAPEGGPIRPEAALPNLLALAHPAPAGADSDTPSLALLDALERRLSRELRGATVYLAGDFAEADRATVLAALHARGARVVAGPFPETDFYVMGESCIVSTIAKLERQGTRALTHAELGVA